MKHQRRKAKPVLNTGYVRLLFVQAHAPREQRTRTLTRQVPFCNRPVCKAAQRQTSLFVLEGQTAGLLGLRVSFMDYLLFKIRAFKFVKCLAANARESCLE